MLDPSASVPTAARVLVVDDEENIRLVLRTLLRRHGYEVELASAVPEAREKFLAFRPQFVLTDVRMRGPSGIEWTRELHDNGALATVIVMSAYGSLELAIEAMQAGAYDYISKPFKQDEVLLTIRKAEERESLLRENRVLRARVRETQESGRTLIGTSAPMEELRRVIEKAAQVASTALILGESGTGKELVAHALHNQGPRRDGPFVAVNCGAIAENLLESELFGHKRGAFTDAVADKVGLFEAAHEGTLFLDEVGDLPLALQVKLLRAIQERMVRRVGDARDRAVDVRLIAATTRDLEADVRAGRFREDLFFRLNILPIVVPPLRARASDIPLLVEHFLRRIKEKLGSKISGVADDALEMLCDYRWPGNVRELENVIERALVLADGALLSVLDLPERLVFEGEASKEKHDAIPETATSEDGTSLSIKKATRTLEESMIKKALERTNGNRTAAAKLLELSHRGLLYKLKEYGIR